MQLRIPGSCIPPGTRKEQKRKPNVTERKETTKIRAEISETDAKKTIKRPMKLSWLFENRNKNDKPLTRLTRKKKGLKIRNERGDITSDTTEIQRVLRDHHEQLYANNLSNREEMNKFLKHTTYKE